MNARPVETIPIPIIHQISPSITLPSAILSATWLAHSGNLYVQVFLIIASHVVCNVSAVRLPQQTVYKVSFVLLATSSIVLPIAALLPVPTATMLMAQQDTVNYALEGVVFARLVTSTAAVPAKLTLILAFLTTRKSTCLHVLITVLMESMKFLVITLASLVILHAYCATPPRLLASNARMSQDRSTITSLSNVWSIVPMVCMVKIPIIHV